MSSLSALQSDALRELCNICGGHAATALSRLMGDARVEMDIPQVDRVPLTELLAMLGPADTEVVAAQVRLQGPVNGELVLALSGVDADQLAVAVANAPSEAAMAQSAFGEAANIVASACLNALFRLTHLTVMPGVPSLARGPAAQVLPKLLGSFSNDAVVLSTELRVARLPMRARLLVVPDPASVSGLLAAMGVAA
jgi:chemotaxis protein CheC